MYLIKNRWFEVKGNQSIAIKYANGVYNKKYDSMPIEGWSIRIEVNPREHKQIDVIKVVEIKDNYVRFMDQNYLEYEWFII